MPQFRYRAVTPQGRVSEGLEEAPTRAHALQALRSRGLVPLKIEPAAETGALSKGDLSTRVRRHGKRRFDSQARALLIRELAALVSAGMPLADALAALERSGGAAPAVALMAGRLLTAVREGRALSQAMAEVGDEAFPPFVRGLVRAGEASGALAGALTRIADALEAQLALAREIRSALTYPALVVIVAAAAVAILLFAVVPEFAGLFADRTAALPTSARMIFWLSTALRAHGLAIAIIVIGGSVAVALWWRDPRRRANRDGWLLRLPRLGALIRLHASARFLQTLGELLAGGVALVTAFELARQALGNRALESRLQTVLPHLRQGRGLADSLKETALLDPLTREMLAAGEQAGALAEMALHAARLAQEHVRRQVQALIALLVPAVTLLLGVIVAGIVGSMLSAILASYDVAF